MRRKVLNQHGLPLTFLETEENVIGVEVIPHQNQVKKTPKFVKMIKEGCLLINSLFKMK